MSNIEQAIEQIRARAGADFAFMLTRRGRLCTRGAPRDMPEPGRLQLLAVAQPLIGTEDVGEVTMPREALVPFGGAAPVDVYVAVASEKAIVCAVMSTWNAKSQVIPAMKAGLLALAPLLEGAGAPKGALRPNAEGPPSARRRRIEAPPASRPPASRPPVSRPPASKASVPKPPASRPSAPKPPASRPSAPRPPDSRPDGRGKRSGLLSVSGPTTHASPGLEQAPEIKSVPPPAEAPPPTPASPPVRGGSLPSITVGEATLGRESLAAIEAEEQEARAERVSLPAISVEEATLGRESLAAIEADERVERSERATLPAISVREASLGPESLTAIEAEARPVLASAPDEIRVSLESAAELPPPSASTLPSSRATRPWVESPEDAKRAADAADAAARPKPRPAPPSARGAEEPPPDTLASLIPTQRGMPPSSPRPSKRRK